LQPPETEIANLLHSGLPEKLGPEQRDLRTQIIILKQRADRQLTKDTCEWHQVLRLLANTLECIAAGDAAHGRSIFQEAESIYYRYNETKNRIRYLIGALIGIGIAAPLGWLLSELAAPLIHVQGASILIFVFAGIGSLTSVLTRISSIDLREETSNFSVYLSGFSRPLVATVLAVIVNVIVNGGIVDIKLGSSGDGKSGAGCLVISFLCGFSERFAEDIIARVPFASQRPNPEQPKRTTQLRGQESAIADQQ
jgi:hypothetical protein